jgi:hypothetical protein
VVNPSRRAFFTGSLLVDAAPADPTRRHFAIAMFLTLLALIFPLSMLEEYCGEKLSSMDLNTWDAMLKEYYTDDRIQEAIYGPRPWLTDDHAGVVPAIYGDRG